MDKFNPTWQQTMLRVRDGQKSSAFYQKHFGMTLIDTYDFPEYKFSLFFLTTLPEGEQYTLTPGTDEAHAYLWNYKGTTLELTWNYGTESDPEFKGYSNGNEEPHRGFGHIAFNTDDVYAVSAELEQAGLQFKKKPDEGRMKGIAFVYDPDGYWIELVKRATPLKNKYNLSQTMIRIKDPAKSIPFYTENFGMTVVNERHFPEGQFSLYFLASLTATEKASAPNPASDESTPYCSSLFNPVLELTHNHGTEKDETFAYHNGNTDPKGFGHTGFLVDNLNEACEELEKRGVKFQKRPQDGKMHNLAFVLDPDNYWVEVIQRDAKF
eukprot:GFYU01003104.1.p1 GENE.GFYU01003104.1~~GFYU01003104.1.p1  ORF type:complete len:324 (+),score=88.97 GFYU01003104.1:47-1018(+)